jgi:hypothetical protein
MIITQQSEAEPSLNGGYCNLRLSGFSPDPVLLTTLKQHNNNKTRMCTLLLSTRTGGEILSLSLRYKCCVTLTGITTNSIIREFFARATRFCKRSHARTNVYGVKDI